MALDGRPGKPAGQLCSYQVGSVICWMPAVLVIDRRTFGKRYVCRVHMDDPAIYADVVENGYAWKIVS